MIGIQVFSTWSDAGQRAQELAAARRQEQELAQSSTTMDTSLAHAGVVTDTVQFPTNTALSPPLHVSSTYTRPANGTYESDHAIYARADNPTRGLLEREMSRLECHGRDLLDDEHPAQSCAFASGMMAISAILMAHATPLVVLLPHDVYHGVPTVLDTVFDRFGQVTKRVYNATAPNTSVDNPQTNHDTGSPPHDAPSPPPCVEQVLAEALQTDPNVHVLVWIETPSNPLTLVTDIADLCQRVRNFTHLREESTPPQQPNNISIVVDSTLAPPPIQQPLLLGADAVVHSATKYLAGHSDVTAGIVTTSPWTSAGQGLGAHLKQVQVSVGGVISPWDAWLTLRGMRTLTVRLEAQCRNAMAMATFCEKQQQLGRGGGQYIAAVHFPGLTSHAQHDVAKRQQGVGRSPNNSVWYGGIFSLELSSEAAAFAMAGALQIITRATSLGGTESLVEHRASIEPAERRTSPPGLLRFSAGLEHVDDLIQDVQQALSIVETVMKEQVKNHEQ